ncbi:hypothetical protein EXIGLDRAFT_712522 [Exidia glandulosa HHB12029]|uniref:DNA mismatch repair proteins mutS family domain-containing protein n=1 Tax=Exidia glandulosa HHB12029 TaxID=1314781 RepID=A0A165ZRC0_EXIGL|nr:hypothetical protein EXIGLDRAFT_712522 [Exidia glandulosa HHB12029]
MPRMGSYDNMFSNSSTFKVELYECLVPELQNLLVARLRMTTWPSLARCCMNAQRTLAPSCLATHYSPLTDDYAFHPQIRNMHMATRVDDEKREFVFLYKLVEGVGTGSFGTHVASLAGVPSDVVERVEVRLRNQVQEEDQGQDAQRSPAPVQADFTYLTKHVNGLSLPDDETRRREVLKTIRQTLAKSSASSA